MAQVLWLAAVHVTLTQVALVWLIQACCLPTSLSTVPPQRPDSSIWSSGGPALADSGHIANLSFLSLQLTSSYNNDPDNWIPQKSCSIFLLDVDKILTANLSHPVCNVNDLKIWPFAEDHKGIEGMGSNMALLILS